MWLVRLVAQRSLASSRSKLLTAFPPRSHIGKLEMRWISLVEEGAHESTNTAHLRRRFSTGRRHGWKGDDEKKPKKNFVEEFIEPAARGELKEKHSSGIPKLAVRKTKGHKIQGALGDGEVIADDFHVPDFELGEEGSLVETMRKDITRARASTSLEAQSAGAGKPLLNALDLGNGKDPDYWREEDFDGRTEEERAYFRATFGVNNSLIGLSREKLDQIRGSGFNWKPAVKSGESEGEDGDPSEEKGPEAEEDSREDQVVKHRGKKISAKDEGTNPGEDYPFFDSSCDKIVTYKADSETAIPMQWSESRLYAYHAESKREPIPFHPQNRKNPHPLILEFYSRWLYVSGLPPALPEAGMEFGKATKLTALEEQEIQKTVTRLFGVSTDQVFPASESSAFIGFESSKSREEVARKGPSTKILSKPVKISTYFPSDGNDDKVKAFLDGADVKTLVKLEDVPPNRFSRETLARDLFPKGSDLGKTYPLSRDDIWFLSPTTALIRMESAEQAKSALSSEKVSSRLQEVGQYPLQLFHAKRNVLHDRMEDSLTELRKLGHRLVVDGDMPSKNFYISHAGVIMLRNLDLDSVTKESISDFFQPYSDIFRDVNGSIEFVTSLNGLPTDIAYVGFERLGEAEAVVDALKGRAQIGENVVILKLVKDRRIPGAPPRRVRPERTEEEIIQNLNDWEQYVDPNDLKYLQEHGVAMEVMNEALRGLRFHNRSFGSLDWAMQEEKLEPDKESGDNYREAVRLYVETLKECVATPENPGVVYEGMHFPGEPIDLSIFETDKKRIKKLLQKRKA